VQLENAEVWLLVSMTTQLLSMLEANDAADAAQVAPAASSGADSDDPFRRLLMPPDDVEVPQDPVMRRLLPDAYRDDPEAAGEFRRLTEGELRATKRDGLSRIIADLSADDVTRRGGGVRLELDEAGAAEWLAALTDLRLALGTRIGVTEDMDAEREQLSVDSPRYAELATYDWLSWLQDAMVRALTGD
jgi:hypothetical protein